MLLFFVGLVLMNYPRIKGEQLETEAAESIVQFVEAKKTGRENTSFSILYPDLYQDMQKYNRRIFEEKQSALKDNLSYAEPSFILSDYGLEAETIAVLNIPALDLSMPVYLGANEENMAAGAAHMEHEEIAYRFFSGDGDGLSQIAAYYNGCYMIPEKCQDIEKSWSFLRELLMADYQLQMCANGFSGFPSNAKAFDEVVNAFLPDGGRDGLISAIEGAAFSGYEMVQMRNIFVEKLKPYIYGNSSYEAALKNAQSSINIFFSEHMP